METNSSNTISAHFLTVIKKALESNGIDSLQLFKQAKISYGNNSGYKNGCGRIKQQAISYVLSKAVKITEDDAFGVKLVNYTTPASNLLTVLAGACDSLRSLFNLGFQSYGETYINSIYPTLEDSNHVRLIFDVADKDKPYPIYTIDFVMSYIVKFFDALLDDPLAAPISIKFERPEPTNLASFYQYFSCPIEFNASNNEICFDKRIYDLYNPLSNQALNSATKSIIENELKKITRIPLSKRTKSYIEYHLPEALPKQEDWANCLSLSVRNMQRQLSEENTSFIDILKDERIELAKSMLQHHVYSVAEISNLLHFSDSSHFIKTFKQETGVTPTAFQSMYGKPESSVCKSTLESLYGRKVKQ